MRTVKGIIAKIGKARFQQMLNIGEKSVSRAESKNLFTSSWRTAIEEELADMGENPPRSALFSDKPRIGKRPKA